MRLLLSLIFRCNFILLWKSLLWLCLNSDKCRLHNKWHSILSLSHFVQFIQDFYKIEKKKKFRKYTFLEGSKKLVLNDIWLVYWSRTKRIYSTYFHALKIGKWVCVCVFLFFEKWNRQAKTLKEIITFDTIELGNCVFVCVCHCQRLWLVC